MIRLTRFQITLTLFALLFLRLTIGYHFFKEGKSKIDSGNFSAEGFLANAKGPLAPHYQKLIEDNDHARLLCYDTDAEEVDPKLTLYIWRTYKDTLASEYKFGSSEKVDKLKQQRIADRTDIERLRSEIAEMSRPGMESDDGKGGLSPTSNPQDDLTLSNSIPRQFLVSLQVVDEEKTAAESDAAESDAAESDAAESNAAESNADEVADKQDGVDKGAEDAKNDEANADAKDEDVKTDEAKADDGKSDDQDEADSAKTAADKPANTTPGNESLQTKRERLDELIARYEQAEKEIWTVRNQRTQADQIYADYSKSLKQYLEENKRGIRNYFVSLDRLEGFRKDGDSRAEVAAEVPSLYGQVNEIKSDIKGESSKWVSTIESMWDNYETELNSIVLPEDRERMTISLTRSHGRPALDFMNKAIPWFDLTIGVLLFIGLFTRLASLLAAGFLFSVISTQPPWILGATETWPQFVEMAGLLVLAATAAGRFAGLDYFIHSLFRSRKPDA